MSDFDIYADFTDVRTQLTNFARQTLSTLRASGFKVEARPDRVTVWEGQHKRVFVNNASIEEFGRAQQYDFALPDSGDLAPPNAPPVNSGTAAVGGRQQDTQNLILIEQRVANEGPSVAAAYLLWFFLWFVSAHRFYLGKSGSAVLQILSYFILIGFVWLLLDAFLIPQMVRDAQQRIRDRYK